MSARSDPAGGQGGGPPGTRSVLLAYRLGDDEAERRLFERCRGLLVARARTHPRMRPVQHEYSPEDVAHEVLWRALSSGLLERFEHRGKGSLEAALQTVLERTLVDMGRRLTARKRGGGRRRVELTPTGGEAPGGIEVLSGQDTTPTSSARARELLELARRVLSDREHEAWHLLEVEGLDSVEAATRLGVSPSAVRGLLFRAQARLIRTLGDERPASALRSQEG
jgi:RNA polymerase sigma factor (sigma-70 family)